MVCTPLYPIPLVYVRVCVRRTHGHHYNHRCFTNVNYGYCDVGTPQNPICSNVGANQRLLQKCLPPLVALDRIVGGQTATSRSFPFLAALMDSSVNFCMGVLVAPNYVMTAAHCGNEKWVKHMHVRSGHH